MKVAGCLRRIGMIYSSKSTCIYENLAFEEWLFRNHDLQQHGEALLLWSNTPSVVIGRHQNPFLEVNLKYCRDNAIRIARRYSGGGTVYHDLGNLNISFLTTHSRHCRPRNLRLIADYFNRYFGRTIIEPNKRDDLVFTSSGSKLSGTAARISHGRAYHHLTLLIDAPLEVLRTSLNSNLQDKLMTNATRSVRAKSVDHLRHVVPDLRVSDVHALMVDAFAEKFDDIRLVDVDHSNERVLAMRDELNSRQWIFGRTPRFTLILPTDDYGDGREKRRIVVEKGVIKESNHPHFSVGSTFHDAYAASPYF